MNDIFHRNRARFDAAYSDTTQAMKLRAKGLLTLTVREGRWLIRRLQRLTGVALPPAARILEVGAGNGYVAANLRLARPDLSITVLDLSWEAVRVSCRQGIAHGVQANALMLPFAAETFDLVIGRAILHHLPDIERLFDELQRILKPAGIGVFFGEPAVPGADRYRRFKRWYGSWFGGTGPRSAVPETDRHARAGYTAASRIWEVRIISTSLLSSYGSFLWYPILLKLKSGWLCDAAHEVTKALINVDDWMATSRSSQWRPEQWVVVTPRAVDGRAGSSGPGEPPAQEAAGWRGAIPAGSESVA